MKQALAVLLVAFLGGCASPGTPPDPTRSPSPATSTARVLADAGAALRDGASADELDAALERLDAIAGAGANDRDFHLLRGRLLLALGRLQLHHRGAGAALLQADAISALRRAVAIRGDAEATLQLAAAEAEAGQLEDAVRTAQLVLRADAGTDPEPVAAAHRLVADAAAALGEAADVAGSGGASWLAVARTSFAALEQRGQLDRSRLATWSRIEARAGDEASAVDVWLRAAAARPDDAAMLDGLVVAAAAHGGLSRALAALEARGDALAMWYRGRIHYELALAVRARGGDDRGDATAALRSLAEARDCFAAAGRAEPTFADSCACWRCLCLGEEGNVSFAIGDVDRAEDCLLQAVTSRPDQLTTDLGDGSTIKLGLLRVGDRVMRDFARAEALYRTAASAVGTDVDLLNNAAVFARDLGTRRERAGKRDEALALFERSYATYGRAVLLQPRDVRLRNDCALVAIHHLGRDWDRARALLEEAAADGEAQLRDAPPADAQQRLDLDEAVGDCHENLALWHLRRGDPTAARDAARRSLGHHPGERRAGAKQHLQAALVALGEDR